MSPSNVCLWTTCGHRRCLNCVWSGVTDGDPDSLMLRCVSCSRRYSEATSVEAAKVDLDQVLREPILANESDTIDLSLCFDKLDDIAARAVRSLALQRGLFVQEGHGTVCVGRPYLEVSRQCFPFRVGTTDIGQVGPVRNITGKKLTPDEEGPDWTCTSCGYSNWRRRDTCRNCMLCPE